MSTDEKDLEEKNGIKPEEECQADSKEMKAKGDAECLGKKDRTDQCEDPDANDEECQAEDEGEAA